MLMLLLMVNPPPNTRSISPESEAPETSISEKITGAVPVVVTDTLPPPPAGPEKLKSNVGEISKAVSVKLPPLWSSAVIIRSPSVANNDPVIFRVILPAPGPPPLAPIPVVNVISPPTTAFISPPLLADDEPNPLRNMSPPTLKLRSPPPVVTFCPAPLILPAAFNVIEPVLDVTSPKEREPAEEITEMLPPCESMSLWSTFPVVLIVMSPLV